VKNPETSYACPDGSRVRPLHVRFESFRAQESAPWPHRLAASRKKAPRGWIRRCGSCVR
jgi:hypothetical protein